MLSSLVRNLCALRKGYPIFRKNRFPLCVMHPYHLGNPVLPTAAAMAGRGDGSGVGQPLLHPLFVPRRSQGQLSSLATSESTGTNSSQYSIPYKMGFENLKVFYIFSSI